MEGQINTHGAGLGSFVLCQQPSLSLSFSLVKLTIKHQPEREGCGGAERTHQCSGVISNH